MTDQHSYVDVPDLADLAEADQAVTDGYINDDTDG